MLIPDNITQFDSKGEKIIYLRFKNDIGAQKFYVLHSLFTNYHLKNYSGELDFIVLAPGLGVFALEVKHGRVRREAGIWYFEDGFGNVNKSYKGPFRQVSDTMHSVRKYILDRARTYSTESKRFEKILFGNGVIFTGMEEFADYGTEAHPWQILSRSTLNLPISYYIESLAYGWHDLSSGKIWYDPNLARPTESDCLKIIEILRGDIGISYSEINRIIDNEYLIDSYTKEQFYLLDFVRYNDRCLIEGQAGTGKTLMALELTRRNSEEAINTALFCYNKELGKKLSKDMEVLLKGSSKFHVAGSLHSFLLNRTGLDVPSEKEQHKSFFEETLPLTFLMNNESMPEDVKFDFLILDEAQDLISPYYMEVFDTLLKGGMKSGRWVLFGDFSRQSLYLKKPDDYIRDLGQITGFVRFPPLTINCRNTMKIAQFNTLITGCDQPKFRLSDRAEDKIVTEFRVKSDLNQCIENIVKDIVTNNIPLKKLTILAPCSLQNTRLLESVYLTDLFESGQLAFSTIQAFKGLENSLIIITGFEKLDTEDHQKLLYVGISRARIKLYLVLNDKLRTEYDKLISQNAAKIQAI